MEIQQNGDRRHRQQAVKTCVQYKSTQEEHKENIGMMHALAANKQTFLLYPAIGGTLEIITNCQII